MTDAEKILKIEEIMDLEPGSLTPETELCEFAEWDSLSWISFIALVDDEFGKLVKGSEVQQIRTVADALRLMEPEA